MRLASRPLRKIAACTGGNFAIEFALGLPLLFLLFAGLFDLGTFAYRKSALIQGAREGAQYGMLNSTDLNAVNATAQNASGLTGVTASSSLIYECVAGTAIPTPPVPTSCSGSSLPPKKYILVTTTQPYTPVIGNLNFGVLGQWSPSVLLSNSISASVTMQVTGN